MLGRIEEMEKKEEVISREEALRQIGLSSFVDQAKKRAFNPDHEYVHVRNVLDGDPYCVLVVRYVTERSS